MIANYAGRARVRAALAAALVALVLATAACGGGDSPVAPDPEPDPDPPPYSQRVSAGWTAFTAGQYASARSSFSAAVALDAAPAEAHVGLGWSELKLDHLDEAHQAFANGADKAGTDDLLADLFAGWAFTWNARSTVAGYHAESNVRVLQAEALAPAWTFTRLPGLDADDLALLAAENFFALGDFDSSLLRVQSLDATFDADVATAGGQAALADKIEALRTAP